MISHDRRALLVGTAAAASTLIAPRMALGQATPGVTATELSIGTTTALSGPVSALGTINKTQAAYFRMLNETQGGIAGRKINYIIYDDGFNPSKTLEMTRKLVEQDQVAFLLSQLGTGPNSAIVKYVNQLGIPHLFLLVNGDKWGDHKQYPWTMPFAPSSRIECQVFIKHALSVNPKAKIAICYQNDDFGRDFVTAAKLALGDRYDQVVKATSYEVTDPTADSQLIQLQGTGADVLISGVTGKFGGLNIRKVADLNWKCAHYVANGAATVASAIIPAGADRAVGTMTSVFLKDPSDPAWNDDPGIKQYKTFMAKWMPEGNPAESLNVIGYMIVIIMHKVLEQCGGNFTRANIMAQVNNLKNVESPLLLPGIKVNTSPTDHYPITQMQLQRWDGKVYQRFGEIIDGNNKI